MAQRPVAVGLVVCEQLIVEENTRNVTLVNCFSQRQAERFPSEFAFVVFALLTDGSGEITLDLVIEGLDNMEEIYRRSTKLRFMNPLHVARCQFRVRDCAFPRGGAYQVSLLADKEIIAQRRITIL